MLLLGAAISLLAGLALSKDTPDFKTFVTEPNIGAVEIKILQDSSADLLAPGYIFIAPYRAFQGWGPQIFDVHGELVWHGAATQKKRAIDVQPCLFNSSHYDHLCYNDAFPVEQVGHSTGVIRAFDNTYTQVGDDFGPAADLRGPDIHELNTPRSQNGKTVLQDVYQVRSRDLSMYRGPADGYILDGCFQEIDVLSREVVFEWCSLDHINIDLTYVYLPNSGNYSIPGIAGDGSPGAPWDWFHINSVDRNDAGDYLVSSRHSNTIYHIAGSENQHGFQPGEVIWRLGGKENSFSMGEGLNFSAQHTIRYHSVEPSSMTVYLFNNANEGQTKTANASSGLLIDLDTKNMQASLASRFVHPFNITVQDQGNLQILPNGNGFVGWGHCNYFTEHSPSGEVLYNAQFGGKGDCEEGQDRFFVSSFRAWKFPWKGYPKQPPKIVAYAGECSGPLYAYVSWNGATEVAKWAFYASNNTNIDDEFSLVATVPATGFETRAKLDFARMVFAAPLAADGHQLAEGSTTNTFVPNPMMGCDEFHCQDVTAQVDEHSVADLCEVESPAGKGAGARVEMSLAAIRGRPKTWLAVSLVVVIMAASLYLARRFRIGLPTWRRATWSYAPLAAAPPTLNYQELNEIRGRQNLDLSKKEINHS